MGSYPTYRTLLLALTLWQLAMSAEAQVQCNGTPLAQASQLSGYPAPFTIAQIQPGDSDAQQLFNAILASGSPALNYPPFAAVNGVPQIGTYNANADPQCAWTWNQCKTPKIPGIAPDYFLCQEPSVWGLSIDDGPTCYHNQLYQTMKQTNQLASLYYIGTNVVQWPVEAQAGYLNGHEICVHTWSHKYTTTLTNEQVFAELYYTKKIIKQVTGASVRCWRPPYGDVDDRVRYIANALDLHTHLWIHDTDDWSLDSGTPAATITHNYQQIINDDHTQEGFVVLTHEISQQTCDMLVQELPVIGAAFDHITPVSTCNDNTNIFGEPNQPNLPNFTQYVAGQRGNARNNAAFWNNGTMTFLGNGTAAQRQAGGIINTSSVASSALPSTTMGQSRPSVASTSSRNDVDPSSVIRAKSSSTAIEIDVFASFAAICSVLYLFKH